MPISPTGIPDRSIQDVTIPVAPDFDVLKHKVDDEVIPAVNSTMTGTGVTSVVALPQSQYDALVTPAATTLYLITGA